MNKDLLVRVYRVVVLALLGYIVVNMNGVSSDVSCDRNIAIDESWSGGHIRTGSGEWREGGNAR